MEDYPRTLAEFEARFSTEEACREYLVRTRWPKGFRCPRCGHEKGWPVGQLLFECRACGYQASVTAGTVFDKTRKPLTLWFRAVWWLAGQRSGASARELQHFLGLGSYQTAWTWLHKLRRAMVRPGRQRLFGTVEAGVKQLHCASLDGTGRGTEQLVAIAAESKGKRGIGRVRLRRLDDLSRGSLGAFLTSSVEPECAVRTGAQGVFHGLEDLGYRHRVVREGGEPHRVTRLGSILDEWLLAAHQGVVRAEHLDAHLNEFTFWFNRRAFQSRGRLFARLLRQALLVEPTPYPSLVRRRQRAGGRRSDDGEGPMPLS